MAVQNKESFPYFELSFPIKNVPNSRKKITEQIVGRFNIIPMSWENFVRMADKDLA